MWAWGGLSGMELWVALFINRVTIGVNATTLDELEVPFVSFGSGKIDESLCHKTLLKKINMLLFGE